MTPAVVFLLRPSDAFACMHPEYTCHQFTEKFNVHGAFLRSQMGVIGNATRCSEKTLRVDPAPNSSVLRVGSLV
ncbi:hypothetical protein BDZ89DRAFT_1070619 [Hymenopellis radicata]|nr:hypothetical protein BDZ89DRAFT_1084223 [Hymenopellis radicata]KAF9022565.1 hypothetical protein BDZ89DRAFT_1070619 [Hymenopellis radicata]